MQRSPVGAAGARSTATHLHERVAEVLGRPVVDDRIDARVEVRQTVPQHAHRLRPAPPTRSTILAA